MKVFLDNTLPFYKANLHCHSVNSDGKLTPEQIKEEYKSRGYSAVAFTDHEHVIDNSHLTDGDFVAITGAELAIKEDLHGSTLTSRNMKATHLCIYSLDPHNNMTPCYNSVYDHFITPSAHGRFRHGEDYERTYSGEGVRDIIDKAHEAGFLVCYNHPGWSLEDATDYLNYYNADFVEIFNTGAVIDGHPDDEAAFSQMLRHGIKILCTASDDNHNRHPIGSGNSDSFGGFVMINAPRLDYSSLMEALRCGRFYSSSAPSIFSLTEDNRKIIVKSTPCRKISLLTRGRYTRSAYPAEGETLSEAQFVLPEGIDGFRVRLEDAEGRHAWSQFYTI